MACALGTPNGMITHSVKPPGFQQICDRYRSISPETCANSFHGSKPIERIQNCANCRFARYCSTDCQKADWPTHQLVCAPLKLQKSPIQPSLFSEKIGQIPPSTIENKYFADSQIFLQTNEIEHDKVLHETASLPAVGNCFLGVASFTSLNFFAVRPVDHCLILDPSQRNQEFLEAIGQVIAASKDRNDCIAKIKKHLQTFFFTRYSEDYAVCNGMANRQHELFLENLKHDHHFLSDDARYEKIKNAFKERRIIVKPVDLSDDRYCLDVKAVMDECALTLDTIYLSNVLEVLLRSRLRGFATSLTNLINDRTHIVDTAERPVKIIPSASAIFYEKDSSLYETILSEESHTKKPQPLIQRVRSRSGESIEDLFPLFKATTSEPLENLFAQYSLNQGYCTEKEIRYAELGVAHVLRVDAIEPSSLCKKDIIIAAMHIEFKNFKKFKQ